MAMGAVMGASTGMNDSSPATTDTIFSAPESFCSRSLCSRTKFVKWPPMSHHFGFSLKRIPFAVLISSTQVDTALVMLVRRPLAWVTQSSQARRAADRAAPAAPESEL